MAYWPRLGVVVGDLFGIELERGARGGNRKEVSDPEPAVSMHQVRLVVSEVPGVVEVSWC